jgi:hypothetical protein
MLQFNEVSTPTKYSFVISFARILLKRLKRNPTSSNPMVKFELEKKGKKGQLKWKMVFERTLLKMLHLTNRSYMNSQVKSP